MATGSEDITDIVERKYRHGFVTDIEQDRVPPGLSEDVVRLISAKKDEPEFCRMAPQGISAMAHHDRADMGARSPTSPLTTSPLSTTRLPSSKDDAPKSLDEVDPKLLEPTTSSAFRCTSELTCRRCRRRRIRQRLGRDHLQGKARRGRRHLLLLLRGGAGASRAGEEVPRLGGALTDNFFAALNSAVFTDGSFVYIPKGVRCPMELSTYFRINAANTGQFERTLIIADEGAYVSYLEGCTAPMRDENQLHAAVVELVALDDAEIKYSTVQNWYPGDENGKGGIYNFVTKRGDCRATVQDLLDPGRDRLRHHLEVPELHPAGRRLRRRVLLGRPDQQLPAGRHRHQDDPHRQEHRSTIISKGISAGRGQNTYRGLVQSRRRRRTRATTPSATRCSSATVRRAHLPVHRSAEPTARSSTRPPPRRSARTRFSTASSAASRRGRRLMIVNGFCKEVFSELPMEFAVEAQKLLGVSLEGAVG